MLLQSTDRHTHQYYASGRWPEAEEFAARLRGNRPLPDDDAAVRRTMVYWEEYYTPPKNQTKIRRLFAAMIAREARAVGGPSAKQQANRRRFAADKLAWRRQQRARGRERAREIAIVRRAWAAGPRRRLRAIWDAASAELGTAAPNSTVLRRVRALLDHAHGRRGVAILRRRLDRIEAYLRDPKRVARRHGRLNPFVVIWSSAKMPSSCWGEYRRVAVMRCEPGHLPAQIREAKGYRTVRTWERCHVGRAQSGRCAFSRAEREAEALAGHLNLLHQARLGERTITIADIVGETNDEFRRELIDGFGGLDAFLAAAGGETIATDETGTLVRVPTAGEPVTAVAVTCPTTGRRYVLRVPPKTQTAREGVAWTFGLSAEEYRPSVES